MVRWPWQKPDTPPPSRPRWVRLVRLLGRGVLAAIMWLLVVAALLTGALLGSSTVRERVLGVGLDVAAKYVPGRLSLEQGAWPTLGHLQLTDLVWTNDSTPADTLAHVALLDLQVDMRALRAGDVRVDSLRAVVPWLAGPAIEAALATDAVTDSCPEPRSGDSYGGRFQLQEGAVPGTPSVAVAFWSVAVQGAVLTADLSVSDVEARGAFDAGRGQQAGLIIQHLGGNLRAAELDSLAGHPLPLAVRHLGLGLSLTAASDSLLDRQVTAAVLDSLTVSLEAAGQADTTAGALVMGLHDIVGRVSLSGQYTAPRFGADLTVDLWPASGPQRGHLVLGVSGDLNAVRAEGVQAAVVVLDTLEIAQPGASVQAAGTSRDGRLDLTLRAAVTDSRLVRSFRPEAGDSLEVTGQLIAAASGPLRQPHVNLRADGRFQAGGVRVPDLSLQLDGDPAGGDLTLRLDQGLSAVGASLDSAVTRVAFVRSDGDSLAAALTTALWRGTDRVTLGGRAWADSLGLSARRRVRVDSLVVVASGHAVRLERPVEVALGPGPLNWVLSPLAFRGESGLITAEGEADSTTIRATAAVELNWPEALLSAVLPSDLWSKAGGVDLQLAARTDISGPRRGPAVTGQMVARLQPHRDEPNLGLDLDLALADGDSVGLQVDLGLVVGDTVAVRGQASIPVGRDEYGRWQLDPALPATVSIPEQNLRLDSLNRLLPPDVGLAGQLSLAAEVRAARAAGDSSGTLAARLATDELNVSLPNRSRATVNVDVQADGSLVDPALRGRIEVSQGFIRIPELPRSLLPTEGEPLLWAMAAADSLSGAPDSQSVFVAPVAEGPSLATNNSQVLPEMDLDLVLPGGLLIHGYGLDTELAGDLKVTRGVAVDGGYQPRMQGLIEMVNGTLQFMNRVFRVERGEIRFTGAVPADPSLDLMLETTVNGILVRIMVTGVASDPRVELTSEPDLEEEDIMGVLLFGRPLGELDDDQRGGVQSESNAGQQLRQNLAGLAMVFGTAGLQNQMSNTFGVDMVEVGSGSAGDATVMVGKFINPKLMLKYHHSLEKSGTYFLTMEYTLSRIFKLVTTYGQGEEDSGLELKWSRRY